MIEIGYKYDIDKCRLFIDFSKISLKAVLLHNGNVERSMPIIHVVNTKETYEAMLRLLRVSSAAAVYFFYQSMAVVINLPYLNLYRT